MHPWFFQSTRPISPAASVTTTFDGRKDTFLSADERSQFRTMRMGSRPFVHLVDERETVRHSLGHLTTLRDKDFATRRATVGELGSD